MNRTSTEKKVRKLRRICDQENPVYGLLSFLKYFSPTPVKLGINLIQDEIKKGYKVNLPLKERLKAYRNGFTSMHYFAYDIHNHQNPKKYLSDINASISSIKIDKNPEHLKNKKKFYEFMNKKGLFHHLPQFYGIIKNGKFEGKSTFSKLLSINKKIVLKPFCGSGGSGIYIVEKTDNGLLVNNNLKTQRKFQNIIEKLDNYIAQEYCNQADFLDNIYPYSANTVRILTIKPANEKPFIAHAFLRIGTKESGYVDNLASGGLSAEVDLKSGKLSAAMGFSSKPTWYDSHPDTGSRIKGKVIPKWDVFINEFEKILNKINEYSLIAWDILFTGKGDFVIIEANCRNPDYKGHQIHKPLLEDDRVKKFYESHGVPV